MSPRIRALPIAPLLWFALAPLCLDASAIGGPGGYEPSQVGRQGRAATVAEAARRGEYDRALELAMAKEDTDSLLWRARSARWRGAWGEADRLLQAALERAAPDRVGDVYAMIVEAARYRPEPGPLTERLRIALAERPDDGALRLALGEMLLAGGERGEARAVLSGFEASYARESAPAPELARVARAMELLGRPSDANTAWRAAHGADEQDPAVLVGWAELLLAKGNVADAERTAKQALAINANHPIALSILARIVHDASNEREGARGYLERAVEVAPGAAEVAVTGARFALDDAQCAEARSAIEPILAAMPLHPGALIVAGGCDVMADDQRALERRTAPLAARPAELAALLVGIGERVARHLRSEQAAALFERALEIDPTSSEAQLALGLARLRQGRDAEGVELVRAAFEADPFLVRAYNVLTLYDEVMPNFSFGQHAGYAVRARNDQFEVIDALLAPVIDRARRVYGEKYGFVPGDDLKIEVYADPTTFGVRSVGVPNIMPHGICFGSVVTMRSPSDGNFNWRQVLWHELAHVWHLQLSASRAPRWFTEGLAEYETNIVDPSWARDSELAIAKFRQRGGRASLEDLDRGFTHARDIEEFSRAYHLASLAIHFIAETWGFDVIPRMLRAWGEGAERGAVIPRVLGVEAADFDRSFDRWLDRELLTFRGQWLPDLSALPSPDELEARLRAMRNDRDARAKLALALLARGELDEAARASERALRGTSSMRWPLYAALRVGLAQGRATEALGHAEALIRAGGEGYEVRMLAAEAARQVEKTERALLHAQAAAQLWPRSSRAWVMVREAARATGDEALARRALERVYELSAHDPALARLIQEGRGRRAREALLRWRDIAPFDARVHERLAADAARRGAWDEAIESWKLLALLRPREARSIVDRARKRLRAAGREEQASALAAWGEERARP